MFAEKIIQSEAHMLLIAELVLFGAGLYLAITGKMASWIAGKGYTAEGGQVRLTGLILALPLPLAFCAGFVIALIDPDLISSITVVEFLLVIISAVVAMIMIRKIRKPIASAVDPTATIEPK
jgi:hypothetical protein